MNINDQMADYAKKNGIAPSKLEQAGKNLDINWRDNAGKSFDTSNGLSKEEFVDMVGSVSRKETSAIKQDAELIFNGLDADGDGKLSTKELSVFNSSGTSVSTYELMHNLENISETCINSCNMEELGDDDEIELENSTYGMQAQTVVTDDSGVSDNSAVTTSSDNSSGDAAVVTSGNGDFQSKFSSDADAKKYLDGFIGGNIKSYDQAIAFLESSGVKLTDDDKNYLEGVVLKDSLSADEKAKVDNLVNTSGMSFKEAAEALNKQGLIKTDVKGIMSKNLLTGQDGAGMVGNLKDSQIERSVEKLDDSMNGGFLGWGTDEDKFDSVMYDSNINGVDMAKIALKYDDEHGSLLDDIRGDFSGDEEDERVEQYAMKLVEGANSGDKDAIKALAKELYSSMDGAGTCEKFVEVVMENASDEVIADMQNHFSDYIGENEDLIDMIEGDFSFKTEDKYVDRIKDAVANIGGPTSTNLATSQIENEVDKLDDSMNGGFLGWGTDEDKFEKVLYGQKSPDDLAAIASKYIDDNGSLLKDIEGDFSGKTEDAHVKQYASQLVQAANNGSDDAIRALTKEMYHSMKGAGTNEVFVETVMNNANDEVLAAINNNYKDYNGTSKSLEKMLKGDFSFKTEDRYVDRLRDAVANAGDN